MHKTYIRQDRIKDSHSCQVFCRFQSWCRNVNPITIILLLSEREKVKSFQIFNYIPILKMRLLMTLVRVPQLGMNSHFFKDICSLQFWKWNEPFLESSCCWMFALNTLTRKEWMIIEYLLYSHSTNNFYIIIFLYYTHTHSPFHPKVVWYR